MRSLEQQRAAHALQRVSELRSHSEPFRKHYRAYVDRLSPAIVMNGLGQALATERAAAGAPPLQGDDKRAHHELYQSLQSWLCRQDDGIYPGEKDLLQAIMSHDESFYLRAQAEALAWLLWHKKFCRAEFPSGEED
jgi:CRISPR-associated protein Cmr5